MAQVPADQDTIVIPGGIENNSNNPKVPPSFAWGSEVVSRRTEWHNTFGDSESDG